MTSPTFAGKPQPYSALNALGAIGRALHEIKTEDGLTWADIGAVLGVSDDQAAKYAEGTATMNAVTFGRAKREWNGRFTGYFDRLCELSRPAATNDREAETTVLTAALALSVALSDGKITPEEIRQNRSTIEAARDALDGLLARLRPAA